MKILIINDSYEEGGGVATYIHATLPYLKKEHEVYLFGFSDNPIKEKNKFLIKNPRGFKRILNRFFFNFNAYYSLKDYIKEINPDIIHIHNNYFCSNSILKALKDSNTRILQTVHDYGVICPTSWCVIKNNLKKCEGSEGIGFKCTKNRCLNLYHFLLTYTRNRLRFKLSRELINLFICPSKELKNYYECYGFRKIIYLPHFIEFGDIKPKKDRIKGPIIYIGVLTRNKGVEYLIKSIKLIKEKLPDIKLNIIGEGSEKEYLKKLSKELNIEDNINFLGKIPHSNVVKEMEKGSILVIPSVWMENSPFVVYEALAASMPIVGSNRGGIPDLVRDNINGLVAEPANLNDLANKIIKILTNKKIYNKFSNNSKKIAEKEFNIKDHIEKLNLVYKYLVK